jgi:hypothetical protein
MGAAADNEANRVSEIVNSLHNFIQEYLCPLFSLSIQRPLRLIIIQSHCNW